MSRRFIPSAQVSDAVSWNFGAVDAASANGLAQNWRAREEAEAARVAAHAQGYEDGLTAGRELATGDIEQFMRQTGNQAASALVAAVNKLGAEFDGTRQAIAAEVLALACELARQVVRSELKSDTQAILPVVEEALGLIVEDNTPRTVRLNPVDLAIATAGLAAHTTATPVHWRADPSLTRGGCMVEAGGCVIDATLEKRWLRAVTNLGLPSTWQEATDVAC